MKLLDAERARMLAQDRKGLANIIVGHMIRVAAGKYDCQLDKMILEARSA